MRLLDNIDMALTLLSAIYTDEGSLIWLSSKNRLLNNEVPLRLLNTEDGANRVRQVLEQLAHGNF